MRKTEKDIKKKRGEWLTCTERSRKCIKYRKSTNEACLKSSLLGLFQTRKRKRYDFEFVTLAFAYFFPLASVWIDSSGWI